MEGPRLRRVEPHVSGDPKDPLAASLHDLTNALAAARSYADVLRLRAKSGALVDATPLVESVLRELDRANAIAREVRAAPPRAGATMRCRACGHTFSGRRAAAKPARCPRCDASGVERVARDARDARDAREG